MLDQSSRVRFAPITACLLFTAALLASASNAWAEIITYNISSYPAAQVDQSTGLSDYVSGTIVANTSTGSISIPQLSITDNGNTYNIAVSLVSDNGLTITPTGLSLSAQIPASYLLANGVDGQGDKAAILWQWFTPNLAIYGATLGSNQLFADLPVNPSTEPGAFPGNGSWIIATVQPQTVPEPSALHLLFSALPALAGVVCLRRRRAKA
jgi:hypothetical protein